jgi:hypothetical protein
MCAAFAFLPGAEPLQDDAAEQFNSLDAAAAALFRAEKSPQLMAV